MPHFAGKFMSLIENRKSALAICGYLLCIFIMLGTLIHPVLSAAFYQQPPKGPVKEPSKAECMMLLEAVSMAEAGEQRSNLLYSPMRVYKDKFSEVQKEVILSARIPEAKTLSTSPNIWGVNMTDEEITTLIEACAQYDDVPVSMALAVIQQESQFTRDIISPDGHDYGFFQIRDGNHSWLQEATGYDPKTPIGNIICGVYMLHYCHELYGPSSRTALTAYRWGSDNGKYGYADAVLETMKNFELNPK